MNSATVWCTCLEYPGNLNSGTCLLAREAQLVPCLRFRLLRFYRSTSCSSVACAGEAQPGRCRWGVIFLDRQIKVLVGIPDPKHVTILVVTIACILGWWIQVIAVTFDCHHHLWLFLLGAAAPKLGATGPTLSCDVNLRKYVRMKWHGNIFVGFQS